MTSSAVASKGGGKVRPSASRSTRTVAGVSALIGIEASPRTAWRSCDDNSWSECHRRARSVAKISTNSRADECERRARFQQFLTVLPRDYDFAGLVVLASAISGRASACPSRLVASMIASTQPALQTPIAAFVSFWCPHIEKSFLTAVTILPQGAILIVCHGGGAEHCSIATQLCFVRCAWEDAILFGDRRFYVIELPC